MISSDLRILQINLNRSIPATETTLQLAIELKIDLVLVQEPWIITSDGNSTTDPNRDYTSARSVNHQGFVQILPNHGKLRPRTLVYYLRSNTSVLASLATSSPQDPDVLVLDLLEGPNKVQLVNLYNHYDQQPINDSDRYRTTDRWLYDYDIPVNTIIAGDFNTHHEWWDPLTTATSSDAELLVDWIEENNLSLLNTPSKGTFFRSHMQRPSVLDLTIATTSLANRIEDWQVLETIGSDHLPVLYTITGTGIQLPQSTSTNYRFNVDKADWALFQTTLTELVTQDQFKTTIEGLRSNQSISSGLRPNQPTSDLDNAAQALTDAILLAAKASIPISLPGARPKPWWSPELKELRQRMMQSQRLVTTSIGSKRQYLTDKNDYFQAVKSAKRNHWNAFLTKNDSKTIFKAMSYTKDRRIERIPAIQSTASSGLAESFTDKAEAFRSALFPKPPVTEPPIWDDYTASDN